MTDFADELTAQVEGYYDSAPEREWERLDRHRTEFAVTSLALRDYLPPPPAAVLDCGGGPGRYAIELARQGYAVTLFDLSARALAFAEKRASEAGVTLAGYEKGTVMDLGRFAPASFDAVLLMGPLYHLSAEAERRAALAGVRRVLTPGGILFAALINRHAVLRYWAHEMVMVPLEHPDSVDLLLQTGIDLPTEEGGQAGFPAYFARADELEPLIWGTGYELVTVLGLDGVVSRIETGVNGLSGPAWDAWVALNYQVAGDPALRGAPEHFLAIARRPRWRTVLRALAQGLAAAGIAYTVTGGTSAALHGVPIAVKDIDVELSGPDAYRCQVLYPGQVSLPVAWREGERYRSHLGRLDFDGVQVELMGDLERWEGERWEPTASLTSDEVDLDGVPVRTTWLEEETLAYQRRGRLNRAALCLARCSPTRLQRLLTGQVPTNMFGRR